MLPTLLLSLALAPAHAANNEFDFEIGRFGVHDDNWSVFSDTSAVPTWGFRGGVALNGYTAIVLSWQHGANGGAVAPSYDDTTDAYTTSTWNLALATNQIAAGPKFDLQLAPWLHPYGTVQAMAWLGSVRLDDDPEDPENVNEIAHTGVAPGGIAALGVDLIPGHEDARIRPATYLEAGYGYAFPMKIADLGNLQFNGFYLHWGVGARF